MKPVGQALQLFRRSSAPGEKLDNSVPETQSSEGNTG